MTTSWGGGDTDTRSWIWTDESAISYSLPDAAPSNYPTVPSEAGTNGASLVAMTATMKEQARLSFELWDDLIEMSLTDAGSATNSDITFNYSMNTDGNGSYTESPSIAQTVGTDNEIELLADLAELDLGFA